MHIALAVRPFLMNPYPRCPFRKGYVYKVMSCAAINEDINGKAKSVWAGSASKANELVIVGAPIAACYIHRRAVSVPDGIKPGHKLGARQAIATAPASNLMGLEIRIRPVIC